MGFSEKLILLLFDFLTFAEYTVIAAEAEDLMLSARKGATEKLCCWSELGLSLTLLFPTLDLIALVGVDPFYYSICWIAHLAFNIFCDHL